jgi:hypothetical protein
MRADVIPAPLIQMRALSCIGSEEAHCGLAGLDVFYQKKSIEATTPINTAFKICFGRRKNELLNRLPS